MKRLVRIVFPTIMAVLLPSNQLGLEGSFNTSKRDFFSGNQLRHFFLVVSS